MYGHKRAPSALLTTEHGYGTICTAESKFNMLTLLAFHASIVSLCGSGGLVVQKVVGSYGCGNKASHPSNDLCKVDQYKYSGDKVQRIWINLTVLAAIFACVIKWFGGQKFDASLVFFGVGYNLENPIYKYQICFSMIKTYFLRLLISQLNHRRPLKELPQLKLQES